MKINQIWTDLENDSSFSHGLLFRRYSGSVLPDVFIALQFPEKLRCIATSISDSVAINLSSFSNLRDISIELFPDELNSRKRILMFKLLSDQFKDIFSVLCEDLIASIFSVTNETQLIRELLNRFEKWKSLFDSAVSQGLSPEEQRGLFGELFFLRKLLRNNSNFFSVVNSWVGSEKQIRDFQFGNWSLEVKTTNGNNHQKIHINSERQLDTNNFENLFLYHISLEERKQSGETLIQIIDSISEILSSDFVSLNRFHNKLLEGGYFDHHRQLYSGTGYFVRKDAFYKVEKDFPRIEERDIRSGVGDVEYSIVISQCSDFVDNEENVLLKLRFE